MFQIYVFVLLVRDTNLKIYLVVYGQMLIFNLGIPLRPHKNNDFV